MRGESRRLRRERDNAKKLLSGCTLWRIAQRDRAVAIMRPVFSANWRTAADVRSVHDHLSRHHAARNRTNRFRFGLGTSPYIPPRKTGNRRCEPPFAASPLAPQPDGLVRITSMTVRDHASLVTHRNYNLVRITVIRSSQKRTCASMLTLTSHYMATNAKHPRYAPSSFAGLATRCNR